MIEIDLLHPRGPSILDSSEDGLDAESLSSKEKYLSRLTTSSFARTIGSLGKASSFLYAIKEVTGGEIRTGHLVAAGAAYFLSTIVTEYANIISELNPLIFTKEKFDGLERRF